MPLRLKSLELHGYKTFAAKTRFEFAEGITAIVGPNGSGKSNIADAIRWVLGEQTYSLLRAKKTEDMIFTGSDQRSRAGMASAGIIFDNNDGWLPVDFSEVGLSRRAYRDGRNEYLLNSQHVRLKDINELLAQSGLSERTYTILGQGLVDASLALKADERRRLFEEAAGIGLYRSRREEALHRLETSQRNLDRVLDILAELEPRLKSLERQAVRAQEYTQVQTDLRLLMHEWYGYHWHRAQQNLTEANTLLRAQETQLTEARAAYQLMRQEFSEFREKTNDLRARLNSWHRQSAQLHETRESISGDLAKLDERQRFLLDNRQAVLSEQSRLNEESKIAGERVVGAEKETANLLAEFEEARAQADAAQTALNDRLTEKSRVEQDFEGARKKIDELTTQHAGLQAHFDELGARSASLDQKLDKVVQSIAQNNKEFKQFADEYNSAGLNRQKSEIVLQAADKEFQAAQKRLSELEENVKQRSAKGAAFKAEQARLKAQIDVLDQAELSLTGYADGAKLLLEAARQSKLFGARGALASALDVPGDLELAISAVLGEFTDSILLASGQNTEQALALLDLDHNSRASILPLDWLAPEEPLNIKPDANCLGVASNLVKAPAEIRPVLDLLLGQVVVVRSRSAARHVLAGLPKHARAVTLAGEVFHATGEVQAGKPSKAAALGRPRQRREFQETLAGVENQIAFLDKEEITFTGLLEDARQRTIVLKKDFETKQGLLEKTRELERQSQSKSDATQRQLEWELDQKHSIDQEISQIKIERAQSAEAISRNEQETTLAQEALRLKTTKLAALSLDDVQDHVTLWGTRSAVGELALSGARATLVERQQDVLHLQGQKDKAESSLMEIDSKLAELENERENLRNQTSGINAQLDELRSFIAPAEKTLEMSVGQEGGWQNKETDEQEVLAHIERLYNQVQLDVSRKQEALAALRQRIEDDFGLVAFDYTPDVTGPVPLPFEGLVEKLPVVTEMAPELEENMIRQRAQLRRMGAVNPEAQQEYKAVKERHTFLTAQVEDLRKAETDLHQVIAELDDLTHREFQKTFDAVAEEFHIIFHRLFGGGSARLTLTDPENLTETGIDIEARLPGRREQGLSLLSGGERSLTAIALVFALLKVSPTPFCVMDEVDAMLDEANVGRFRDQLLELSKDTQFIIITHNRNTVQAADVIYGVTMGRDSASQIISLKLDEITEEFLK
jgi:chromosome segregation protein